MKKIIPVIILVVVIIPSVAFASWWNPFSWFNNWNFQKRAEVVNIISNEQEVSKNEVADEKQEIEIRELKNNPTQDIQRKPNISDTTDLKEVVKILEDKVTTLENENDKIKTVITKNIKIEPEITLNKSIINNDGVDRARFNIKTINSIGEIIPNKNIEITTSVSDSSREVQNKVEIIKTNNEGEVIYYTPTTTIYNRCGMYMNVTIKIDNIFVYGKTINIKNVKDIPESKVNGNIPPPACA